jgi:ribokinase
MLLAVTSASETTSSPSHLTTTRRRFHSGPGESSCCLVVGSANADTFLPVARLPSEGENLTLLPGTEPFVDVPGGKGCTQAVAVSKLLSSSSSLSPSTTTKFVGQVGDDHAGKILLQALDGAGVDCTDCGIHPNLSSGRGYVFLTQSGSVSAVVSGGSNVDGWTGWEEAWNIRRKQRQGNGSNDDDRRATTATFSQAVEEQLDQLLDGVKCILLQREVPEYVNLLVATCAKERDNTIIICQDVGGEDRPISSEMLQLCDFVIPNESELIRLVESSSSLGPVDTSHCTNDDERVVEYARALQKIGATNVLVTRGSKGSTLLTQDGQIIHQSAIRVPPGRSVVDETGAGDCYRAAFAVALLEGHSWKQCMVFASAAGSCSVEVNGAVPSTPSRDRVMDRLAEEMVFEIPRGDGQARPDEEEGGHAAGEKPMAFVRKPASSNSNSNNNNVPRGGHGGGNDDEDDFPFLFGSRLNSMKDRPDLWEGKPLDNPREYVKRQATVRGLTVSIQCITIRMAS